MSRTITIALLGGRFPECQETACRWDGDCTQHYSAGDFRMECGMRPVWLGYDPVNLTASCVSAAITDLELLPIGEAFTIDDVAPQLTLFGDDL